MGQKLENAVISEINYLFIEISSSLQSFEFFKCRVGFKLKYFKFINLK